MERLGIYPEAVLCEAEVHDGRQADGLIYGLRSQVRKLRGSDDPAELEQEK